MKKRKGEKKEEYQARQAKAETFRKELYEKYYRIHLENLNQ